MKTFLPLLLIVAALGIFLVFSKLRKPEKSSDLFPYKKIGFLFSPAERSFFGVLGQAVGNEYAIFGKVRVADVVSVKSVADKGGWRRAFNRISAKHFDFVICAKGDLSVVCVVELDDQSHQERKRQERDAFLVKLCQAVSLPLIQIPAQRAYTVADIRAKFFQVLEQQSRAVLIQSTDAPQPQVLANQSRTSISSDSSAQLVNKATVPVNTPVCPRCAAPMVQRAVKTGSRAGEKFWGCSTFPKCRGVTLAS
jgi:ssDNA-binding Zn-finger/Zn-ribbon topoisomerase 1